ncbi:MAG: hypothetical protein WA120_05320 [Candidatus Hydromicrobium sp.]
MIASNIKSFLMSGWAEMSSLDLLYGNMVNMISPELQVISCSWGSVNYKKIKKYLGSLSRLHLEIKGETLKDMGY